MSSGSKEENTEADEIAKSPAEHESEEKCEESKGAASGKTDDKIKEKRERKLTEKGKEYRREVLDSTRKAASTKLRQKIEKIKSLINSSEPAWVVLQLERDGLDQIKEDFNRNKEIKQLRWLGAQNENFSAMPSRKIKAIQEEYGRQ